MLNGLLPIIFAPFTAPRIIMVTLPVALRSLKFFFLLWHGLWLVKNDKVFKNILVATNEIIDDFRVRLLWRIKAFHICPFNQLLLSLEMMSGERECDYILILSIRYAPVSGELKFNVDASVLGKLGGVLGDGLDLLIFF